MKRILLTLAAGFVACSVFGQGGVVINTRGGGVDARVTDSLTGQFVSGNAYLAQLYYGAPGVAESAMVQVLNAAAPAGTTAAPAYFSAGTLPGYILTSTGGGNRYTDPAVVAPGANTDFQLRAWQATLGATWEAALGNWSATTVLGKSAIITVATSANNLDTPKPLTGLAAFTLDPIPEPSVIALGALGLAALLWRRRK
jgi:hypothetical protein